MTENPICLEHSHINAYVLAIFTKHDPLHVVESPDLSFKELFISFLNQILKVLRVDERAARFNYNLHF